MGNGGAGTKGARSGAQFWGGVYQSDDSKPILRAAWLGGLDGAGWVAVDLS